MIIDDSTPADVVFDRRFARGCVPPDYKLHPEATILRRAQPSDIKLIPRGEWSARIAEKKRLKTNLSDIRRTSGPGGGLIPSLNQGQVGYCWAHSSTMGNMLLRAIMGLSYVKLSAFMVASILKNGLDEGGWGALSLDWIGRNGQATQAEWPEGSRNLSLDTPATREVAKRYRVTADWADLRSAVYDRNMTEEQVATLLLNNVPVVGDFNWWGHSVVLMDWCEVEPGSFGPKGLNSWGDAWGDSGEFTLRGQKAHTDGAVAPMATMATMFPTSV